MNFTSEQLAKAKTSKSAEELLAYSIEIGYALTEDEAKKYFEQWHKEGELADDELDNVSGGSFCVNGKTYSDDPPHYLITTALNCCEEFVREDNGSNACAYCKWRSYTDFPMYCQKRTADHDALNSAIGGGFYQ